MSRTLLIALLLAATSALAARYPQHVQTSFSLMPPNQETRIVEGDTVQNPVNYEVAVGYERPEGWTKLWAWAWWERENGIDMTGLDVRSVWGGKHLEAGTWLTHRDDRDIHTAQWHLAAKFHKGAIGVGVTRQYYSLWGDPAWLARLSLDCSVPDVFALHAVYERGANSRQRMACEAKVTPISFGPDDRLRFGPIAKGMILQGPNGRRASYQVKLVLSMRL